MPSTPIAGVSTVILQTYYPPPEPLPAVTLYGAPSTGAGSTSTTVPPWHVDAPVEHSGSPEFLASVPTVPWSWSHAGDRMDGIPQVLGTRSQVFGIGSAPQVERSVISYGDGAFNNWQSNLQDAGQVALVILMVWIGIRFLIALTRGVKFALRFLLRVITFPFRLIAFAFRQVRKMPARLTSMFFGGEPVARQASQAAGATYTKAAEGWNQQEARGWPAFEGMRRAWHQEKKHFAGLVGITREKWNDHRERFEGHRDSMLEHKDHLLEQKRLLKKLGRKEYMRRVIAGNGVPDAGDRPDSSGFTTTRPKGQPHTFPGYRVTKELPRGGSGAQLFLATPRSTHAREMAERGIELPEHVVIKSFSLQSGAHMAGILREGRALDAARQLGQVLEHSSGDDGMYYVMPFVPGETLDVYIAKLHRLANGSYPSPEELKTELATKQLQQVLGLGLDLISELERFHDHGLWHKDIKPGNLIVNQGRLHIVDLGLLTPLASALTLTTHGTEYFRDPEMVRLAMGGAQVRDVDAVKFDLYSAGAVLFSMLEGTFPAHGNLSRLQRPCPPALAWVVRRAMSEHDSRYASAQIMRADLAFLCQAKDLNKVKPVDLPSWNQENVAPVARPLAQAPKHAAPESEVETPAQPQRRSWGAVIPKKAVFAALVAVVALGWVTEGEPVGNAVASASTEARQSVANAPNGFVDMQRQLGEAKIVLDESLRTVKDAFGLRGTFAGNASESDWSRQGERLVEGLLQAVPMEKLHAVYIHLGDLSPLAQELAGRLGQQLESHGVQVLKGNDGASVELSAQASALLDTLAPGQDPEPEQQVRFFNAQPEVQAVVHFVETPTGVEASWVVGPQAGE